jgi:hypothetical protein
MPNILKEDLSTIVFHLGVEVAQVWVKVGTPVKVTGCEPERFCFTNGATSGYTKENCDYDDR